MAYWTIKCAQKYSKISPGIQRCLILKSLCTVDLCVTTSPECWTFSRPRVFLSPVNDGLSYPGQETDDCGREQQGGREVERAPHVTSLIDQVPTDGGTCCVKETFSAQFTLDFRLMAFVAFYKGPPNTRFLSTDFCGQTSREVFSETMRHFTTTL